MRERERGEYSLEIPYFLEKPLSSHSWHTPTLKPPDKELENLVMGPER